MKNKIFIIFISFFIFLFFIGINTVFAFTDIDIPDVVLQKAKELNHGYDNFVILRDTITKEFYLPYETSVYSSENYQNKNWRYTTYKGTNCIITPSWWLTGLKVYRNNSFIEATTNSVGSNSIIQMSMGERNLEIVFSSKDVLYYNIEGIEDGTVFFQKAPLVGVVVPAVEKVEQIPITIMKTLKIVIPVGLVVFSMVLLVFLIKSVLSRMA